MVTRRNLLGTALTAGAMALAPAGAARAIGNAPSASPNVRGAGPVSLGVYRIAGSAATVLLRNGPPAAVLLHIARRWHYEIGRLDTGEGGGVIGYTAKPSTHDSFGPHYMAGTAIAVYPAAYPPGGSERLWPHHELIVSDILADCEGVVAWGGHLDPITDSHFHIAAPPGDRTLMRVAAQLDTGRHKGLTRQTPGAVADPASPIRAAVRRR